MIGEIIYTVELHDDLKEEIDFNRENNIFDVEIERAHALLAEIDRLNELSRWRHVTEKPTVSKNTLCICVFHSPLGSYVDRAMYFPGQQRFSSESVIYWMFMPDLPSNFKG